jgi:hypothetical protein
LPRNKLWLAAAALVVGLFATASAEAGFVIKVERLDVTTGAVLQTLSPDVRDRYGSTNAGSIDTDAAEGFIEFNLLNAFGQNGLNLNIAADSTHDLYSALLNQVESSATNNSSSAQRIRVSVTDTGYNGPAVEWNPLYLKGSAVYNSTGSNGVTATYSAWVDTDGAEFGSADATVGVPNVTTSSVEDRTVFSRGASPFSVTMVMDFTLAAYGGRVRGLTGSAEVVPTPAPATAVLALAGVPVLGAFGWLRRRKTTLPVA